MLAKQHTSAENPAFFRDVALLNKSDRLLREVGDVVSPKLASRISVSFVS
jgi:hypothetical protein